MEWVYVALAIIGLTLLAIIRSHMTLLSQAVEKIERRLVEQFSPNENQHNITNLLKDLQQTNEKLLRAIHKDTSNLEANVTRLLVTNSLMEKGIHKTSDQIIKAQEKTTDSIAELYMEMHSLHKTLSYLQYLQYGRE